MSHLIRLLIVSSLFLAVSCFEVLQTIDTKRDGTIRIALRISMSKALQKEGQKTGKAPQANDFVHDSKRIHNNLKVQDLSDDLTLRRQFEFSTTRTLLGQVSESDKGMFLPYPDGSNQWVFLFRPSKDKKASPTPEDPKGEQLAMAFLSSANYRIFFRGRNLPHTVAFTALDGTRHELRPTPFGDGMLVDCPLILLFQGGVLTTAADGKLDFHRTDRLIEYLKESVDRPTPDGENEEKSSSTNENQDSRRTKESSESPVSDSDVITVPPVENRVRDRAVRQL